MPEAGNYFAWLGLAPGTYAEQELADRLADVRRGQLDEGRLAGATLAYSVLCDPERQASYLRSLVADPQGLPPSAELPSAQIEAAFSAAVTSLLEGGDAGPVFLRYSNRRRLLDLGGRLGINPFEANLLIERARFRATRPAHRPAWARWLTGNRPPDGQTAQPASTRISSRTRWLVAVALALALDAVMLLVLFH